MASALGPTEGNWPSFVYVTVLKGKALSRVLSRALRHGGAFVPLSEQQLHISLSKTFYLRAHHIEPFLHELSLSIGLISRCVPVCSSPVHCPRIPLPLSYLSRSLPAFAPFTLRFQVRAGGCEPIVLANETQSSEYLCVRVTDISGGLQQLVKAVDEIMVRFRQPTYFDEPIFHISVAENRSTPAGDVQEAEVVVSKGQEDDDDQYDEEDEGEEGDAEEASPVCVLPVCTIGCSIGNRHFRLDLKAEVGRQTKMSRLDFREVGRKGESQRD